MILDPIPDFFTYINNFADVTVKLTSRAGLVIIRLPLYRCTFNNFTVCLSFSLSLSFISISLFLSSQSLFFALLPCCSFSASLCNTLTIMQTLPASSLSRCHGLGEFVSPSLVWRGNLSVLDPVHGNTNIQAGIYILC